MLRVTIEKVLIYILVCWQTKKVKKKSNSVATNQLEIKDGEYLNAIADAVFY